MPTLSLSDLDEVDYDPFKRQGLLDQFGQVSEARPQPDLTAAARAGKLGTLSGGDPSWGDQLSGGFSNAVGMLGATPTGQKNAYDVGHTLTGIIPGVNNAVSANQAYRDFGSGNYLGGALNTVGAIIPPVPGASGVAEEAIGTAARAAAPATRDFSKELAAFGKGWKRAPVIDSTGNVVHGSIDPDVSLGGNLGILDEQGNLTKGLLGYHGSQHKWDEVDLSKIGTGEGTTDEGWGFYQGTHPDVGEYYRGVGAGDPRLLDKSGNPVPVDSISDSVAHSTLLAKDKDWDRAIAHLEKGSKWGDPKIFPDALETIKSWRDKGFTLEPPPETHKYMLASSYDPDNYLNFNRPLNKQSQFVQDAVAKLGEFHPRATGKDVHDWIHADEAMGGTGADLGIENNPKDYVDGSGGFEEPLTKEEYQRAAKRMQATGLPGVKYLDNASEEGAAPSKTFNYVTYGNAIKVLKRYGIAGLGGAGMTDIYMHHPNMTKHQLDEDELSD